MIKGWTAGEVLLVAEDARKNRRKPEHEVARRLMIEPAHAKKLISECEAEIARAQEDR